MTARIPTGRPLYVCLLTVALSLTPVTALAGARVESANSSLAKDIAAKLEAHPELDEATALKLSESAGVVTITGRAPNLFQRQLAARVAEGVSGVQLVRPAIQIPAPPHKSDELAELRDQVEALVREAAGSGVAVSLDAGRVLLRGETTSSQRSWGALTAAARVPGVSFVDSELHVRAPSLEDQALARELRQQLMEAGLREVRVEVANATVNVSGSVSQLADAIRARSLISRRPEVRAIHSSLRIVLSKQPLGKGQRMSDAEMARRAEAALTQAGLRGVGDLIRVGCVNGVITLVGRVGSEDELTQAEQASASVAGVTGILNSLTIGGPESH